MENSDPSNPSAVKAKDRQSAFSSLRHRDFRLLWIGQSISVTGSQMQLAAINWHIYLITHSALALGLVGLCRAVPIILCSLMGGVVADVVDRRRLMVVTQTIMLLCSAILALVTFSGLRHAWPIFLLTAIASAAWAFDTPARQSLMPTLVPIKDFPNAASLSILVFQIGLISGPPLAGFLLATRGPDLVYGINAASFIAVIVGLLLMHTSGKPEKSETEKSEISLKALVEGLSFVWRTPIIVQTMTLDFVATFFASANQLLPIYAKDILNVGARGYGLLGAAPAMGADQRVALLLLVLLAGLLPGHLQGAAGAELRHGEVGGGEDGGEGRQADQHRGRLGAREPEPLVHAAERGGPLHRHADRSPHHEGAEAELDR